MFIVCLPNRRVLLFKTFNVSSDLQPTLPVSRPVRDVDSRFKRLDQSDICQYDTRLQNVKFQFEFRFQFYLQGSTLGLEIVKNRLEYALFARTLITPQFVFNEPGPVIDRAGPA